MMCEHEDNEGGQHCHNLFLCLEELKELVDTSSLSAECKEELIYDYCVASADVLEWITHFSKGVYTQKTKEKIVKELSEI